MEARDRSAVYRMLPPSVRAAAESAWRKSPESVKAAAALGLSWIAEGEVAPGELTYEEFFIRTNRAAEDSGEYRLLKAKGAKPIELTTDGAHATVTAEGPLGRETYEFTLEDGRWYLDPRPR